MEEGKKQQEQHSVDYLIKQGYKKLSAKTFISDVDLEQFLNKDFSNINKTRALGFIQILEREYNVDLSELRSDYLTYESSHRPEEPETLFTETPIANDKEWQKYLPFIAAALVIFGLAFYLFRPSIESVQTPEPQIKQLEENKSVINEAQKNIEKLETNKTIVTVIEKNLTQENNISTLSKTSTNDDLDLDKIVLQMMKERNISSQDSNLTLDINKSIKTVKEPIVNEVQKKPAPVVIKDVATGSTVKEESKKKMLTKRELYIKPKQKAWVGVIYLDDFTKKDFLIRTKLPLDANRNQLIIVGHGKFKIFNKSYSVKFRGKGPVRFIYRDGELMEISKKEFIRTSAGVAW